MTNPDPNTLDDLDQTDGDDVTEAARFTWVDGDVQITPPPAGTEVTDVEPTTPDGGTGD